MHYGPFMVTENGTKDINKIL